MCHDHWTAKSTRATSTGVGSTATGEQRRIQYKYTVSLSVFPVLHLKDGPVTASLKAGESKHFKYCMVLTTRVTSNGMTVTACTSGGVYLPCIYMHAR